MILNKLLILFTILFFLLCVLVPLKESSLAKKNRWISTILKYHAVYGWAFVVTAFLHGICSGNNPGMFTGKAAWCSLLLCLLTAKFGGRQSNVWRRIHRGLAAVSILLVLIHILSV